MRLSCYSWTSFHIDKYISTIIQKTGGEHSLKNGIRECATLKTPFSHPPDYSQDHHFNIRHFSRPYCHTKIKSQMSKASKLAKSSVPKSQIRLKFSSQGCIFLWNSVHKGFKFSCGPFTNPSVWPFGPHTYTKMKVECPPIPGRKPHLSFHYIESKHLNFIQLWERTRVSVLSQSKYAVTSHPFSKWDKV